MSKSAQTIPNDLIEALLAQRPRPEELLGNDGLIQQLAQQLIARSLDLKTSENAKPSQSLSASKVTADVGGPLLEGDAPAARKRTSSKGRTIPPGLDTKIIDMYAKGLTPREIHEQILDFYGIDLSPATIGNVTDAAIDEVKAWQSRPLDAVYPIVYMDCIHVRVRDGASRPKAVYVVIGISITGQKEAIGLWVSPNEGAKFWLQVLTEIKNRGVQDIYIACVDGLKGFPDAIATVFPRATVQLCVVHMVRNSLDFVSWKARKQVALDLRPIYTATTVEAAAAALSDFESKWAAEYPTIGQAWRRNWAQLTPFFDFPKEIRKIIYTTNTIESINMSLRRVMRYRGTFQNDESLLKLLYLALRNISRRWTLPVHDWKAALNRFAIQFGPEE
ncbi:IS256 family transposase [Lysobacter soli]|uniref:Mutator family transposase n=1 Tax=Lysobacter soli TaxID=453783 RepID=A0A3D8VE92_9GAMM|nr:IS256 family transposase [Lysobacter soli]RDY67713.1 IS256 family transposase [Lysobacter soli]